LSPKFIAPVAALLALSWPALPDCVVGAKLALSYVILDQNTLILKNAGGHDILIKSFAFFYPGTSITVLKDSFCDFATAVLYANGETIDVQEVKNL
jgi:hypothetical protein